MNDINLLKVDEIALSFKPRRTKAKRPQIETSRDAYNVLKANWSSDISLREEFNLLLLDNQNNVLGISNLSKGGITSTVADIRLAFVTALKSNACAIIISHNHPSGATRPSYQDNELTKKFVQAGKILDIKVHDHIILVPDDDYYSFEDNGFEMSQ